jgi:hypothetical protein
MRSRKYAGLDPRHCKFCLIHLSYVFQTLNWKDVECGNIILVQDSADERHLLLRPIESVSQEEFYSVMESVLKGEKKRTAGKEYLTNEGVWEVRSTANTPVVAMKVL